MRNEREIAREAKINNKAASKHKRNKRSVQEPMGSLKAARGNLLTEYEDIAKNIKRLFFPSPSLLLQKKVGTYARVDINFPGMERRLIEGNQDRVSAGDQEIRTSEKLPKV